MTRSIRNRPSLHAVIVGGVLVASACSDEPTSNGPITPPAATALQQNVQSDAALDPMVAHARAIPGFGGLFLDPSSGAPTIYLTDISQRTIAERELTGELRALGTTASQLRVLKGDYDYLQLDSWLNQAASQALALPGVVFVDADEGRNRLRVGIEAVAAEGAVRSTLARLSIPLQAVIVEQTEPIRARATLRQNINPETGGLQISSVNGTCTLGFNSQGTTFLSPRFFVTNTHCTTTWGVTDGTTFSQPTVSSANVIGTEVSDPGYFTTFPCPSGRRCRLSDAALVRYGSTISIDKGGIARTTGPGSITIDAANPVFNITAEQASPILFSAKHKIGRTSGWTSGVVSGTCMGVNVSNSNVTLLCQDRVNAISLPGDSGSPVFSWPSAGSSVTLNGIMWGGNSAGTQFFFSRMSGIESELGNLTTF